MNLYDLHADKQKLKGSDKIPATIKKLVNAAAVGAVTDALKER